MEASIVGVAVLEITDYEQITRTARLEAEKAYMKRDVSGLKETREVYLFPTAAKTLGDLFLFVRHYDETLSNLKSVKHRIPDRDEEIFF